MEEERQKKKVSVECEIQSFMCVDEDSVPYYYIFGNGASYYSGTNIDAGYDTIL